MLATSFLQSRMAKVIVMFNEDDSDTSTHGVLASLRAKPTQIRGDGMPMKREELYDRAGIGSALV